VYARSHVCDERVVAVVDATAATSHARPISTCLRAVCVARPRACAMWYARVVRAHVRCCCGFDEIVCVHQAETCTGSSPFCPFDSLQPRFTVCRQSAGYVCVAYVSHLSCVSRRPCDTVGQCTGASALCPPDAVQAAGFICRVANGVCDVSEVRSCACACVHASTALRRRCAMADRRRVPPTPMRRVQWRVDLLLVR
jgi:hypothetical protein